MALKLEVFPQDARGRGLPVSCRIRLQRDEQQLADEICDANGSVAFADLLENHVYIVTIRSEPFETTPSFVPLEQHDGRLEQFCLAKASRASLKQPVLYTDLPEPLQKMLESSTELGLANTKDRTDDRQLSEDRPLESRSLPSREFQKARSLPERVDRPIREGEGRWNALSDEEQAGLLNLYAKMNSVTLFPDSAPPRTTWTYIIALIEIARDRIKAKVNPDLKKDTEASKAFRDANERLPIFHHPRAGFSRSGSWKSHEPFGNLQLTFSTSDEDNRDMELDADVDDAAGVGHAEQVARNEGRGLLRRIFGRVIPGLPEGTTHPYDIHQILVRNQRPSPELPGIGAYVPNYRLVLNGAPADYEL